MQRSLRDAVLSSGGVIDGATSLPLHFGNPEAELRGALHRCVLTDRSDLIRLIATGPDMLGLLHRLSTADVAALAAGEGKPTVLTTPKGRIVERLFVHHLGEAGLLMVGGPGRPDRVLEHVRRHTFAEQTGLADASPDGALLALVGPMAPEALLAAGLEKPAPHGSSTQVYDGHRVHVLGHDGTSTAGFCVMVPHAGAASLWRGLSLAVSSIDGRPAGLEAVEASRVLHGFPIGGRELTEDHNPLEAGLWEAVSFDKGCYVGQEVVARLRTYDKVTRAIVGLRLPPDAPVPAGGTPLFAGERRVGAITSAVLPPGWGHPVALAYVKRKDAEPGTRLSQGSAGGSATAEIVELPFVP